MQQAITWANVDPDVCRRMASLGPSELSIIFQILYNLFWKMSKFFHTGK